MPEQFNIRLTCFCRCMAYRLHCWRRFGSWSNGARLSFDTLCGCRLWSSRAVSQFAHTLTMNILVTLFWSGRLAVCNSIQHALSVGCCPKALWKIASTLASPVNHIGKPTIQLGHCWAQRKGDDCTVNKSCTVSTGMNSCAKPRQLSMV